MFRESITLIVVRKKNLQGKLRIMQCNVHSGQCYTNTCALHNVCSQGSKVMAWLSLCALWPPSWDVADIQASCYAVQYSISKKVGMNKWFAKLLLLILLKVDLWMTQALYRMHMYFLWTRYLSTAFAPGAFGYLVWARTKVDTDSGSPIHELSCPQSVKMGDVASYHYKSAFRGPIQIFPPESAEKHDNVLSVKANLQP